MRARAALAAVCLCLCGAFAGASHAGPIRALETQYNSGKPLLVVTPESRGLWSKDRAAKLRFESIRREGRRIFAEYDRVHHRRVVAHGWMLADLTEDGRLGFVIVTRETPPEGVSGRYGMEFAQGADAASTAIGVAGGAAELNPLGFTGVIAAKAAMLWSVRHGSIENCYQMVAASKQFGWGAAGWNVAALAGAGPVAAVPAVIGFLSAKPSHNERFWACAPGGPALE